MNTPRTSWQVTRDVWYALFMREAVARTSADRFAWFWMLIEPIAYVAIMISIRTVVMGKERTILGAEFVPWLIVGLFGFFVFRENMMRSIGVIDAHKGLFAYRQVTPVDTVLVRSYLEGMLRSLIFLLFIAAGIWLEMGLMPADPLVALGLWLSLWALGLSGGLVLSVVASLVPEVGRLIRLISLPLMLMSGVIFPLNFLPHEVQQYLLWNPVVHGLELLRAGFFPVYHTMSGVSVMYLWYWTLVNMVLGLALHLKYAQRLKAQ